MTQWFSAFLLNGAINLTAENKAAMEGNDQGLKGRGCPCLVTLANWSRGIN